MPGFPPLVPVLAADDMIVGGIIFLLTVVGWVANLISSKNQKGPPVANRPRPPVRPRDDKLQQEINIFVEDVGAQRRKGAAPRQAVPAGRAAAGQPAGRGQPAVRKTAAAKPPRKQRPGETLASRPAPVTETLGAGVKQSLSQHMVDRVSQEVQQRLAPRVDERVAADLGPTMSSGASMRAPALPAAVSATVRADRFGELLRNPANVRQAIVLNLILSAPPALAGKSRR
ncbi:MAG TPA: hypothetical protein VKH44_02765 [Pirellulaceae bacterium]|nr:hypothetical protein [Pirellulaceae bacterium]